MSMVGGMFGKKNSAEETMASLAQSNPEALGAFVSAQAALIEAKVKQFNQDLPDEPIPEGAWKWIISIRELLEVYRGAIRPLVVTVAFIHITYTLYAGGPAALALIPEWVRVQYEIAINSWFGDRWK
jgi:hypothetical protein